MVTGCHLELLCEPSQTPPPPPPPQTHGIRWGYGPADLRRGIEAKGAIKQVDPRPNQFTSQIFLVPKKDDSKHPVVNLKPLNRLILKTEIQDGGGQGNSGSDQAKRLDDFNRLEGCISVSTDLSIPQEIPQICVEGDNVRVSVSHVWTV